MSGEYHVRPLGLNNNSNFCWFNSLFQCLYWTPFYRSVLIKYLPLAQYPDKKLYHPSIDPFPCQIWISTLEKYQQCVKVCGRPDLLNQVSSFVKTELKEQCFPEHFSQTEVLTRSLFPENYFMAPITPTTFKLTMYNSEERKGEGKREAESETLLGPTEELKYRHKQEDVNEAFIKLLSLLPDRERIYCQSHADPHEHVLLEMFYSQTSKIQPDKNCVTCTELEEINEASHGHPIDKYILGRAITYLIKVDSPQPLVAEPLSDYSYVYRFLYNGLNFIHLSEYYMPYDNDTISEIIIPFPPSLNAASTQTLDFEYLINKYVFEKYKPEHRYQLKALDHETKTLHLYEVIGKKRELFISPDTNHPPENLVLSFNRFTYLSTGQPHKIFTKIDIPLTFNFHNLFCPIQPRIKTLSHTAFEYELTAFIVHMGKYQSGHYVSFVSIPESTEERKAKRRWYLCNDRQVKEIPISQVKYSVEFAYICFFSCINNV